MPPPPGIEVVLLGITMPALVAVALISGAVSFAVAALNWWVTQATNRSKFDADRTALEKRIDADLDLAVRRVHADQENVRSEQAWSEFENRRELYAELLERIDVLFSVGNPTLKPEFHKTARKVRLSGSDDVVLAFNAMTDAIKAGAVDELDARYRALCLTLRRDLRTAYTAPPTGTALDESAFPIEA